MSTRVERVAAGHGGWRLTVFGELREKILLVSSGQCNALSAREALIRRRWKIRYIPVCEKCLHYCSRALRVRGLKCRCRLASARFTLVEIVLVLGICLTSSLGEIVLLTSASLTSDKPHPPRLYPAHLPLSQPGPRTLWSAVFSRQQHQNTLRPAYRAPSAASTNYMESRSASASRSILIFAIPEEFVSQHQIPQIGAANGNGIKAVSR
jgi:hypothetical protein